MKMQPSTTRSIGRSSGVQGRINKAMAGWLALCNAVRFALRRRQPRTLSRRGRRRAWFLLAGRPTCSSLRHWLESTAMDGRIDVSTLLFLVLAVVIFLKLRSVLGRRTGHEQARFERYKAQQEASQRNGKLAGQDKVVTLPRREREEAEPRPAAEPQCAPTSRSGSRAWPPATPASPRVWSTSSAPTRASIPTTSSKAPGRPTRSSSRPSPRATARR